MSEKKLAIEKIREHISSHPELSEEDKSNSFRHIEEWYAEDKGFGSLYEMLSEISPDIETIFEDLGLM